MARDVFHKDDLFRYEIRPKFKLKVRTPRNNEKYEVPHPFGTTPTEAAELNEERMYQYLRATLRDIIDDVDVGDLLDLTTAVREALRDDDVKMALHNQKRRYNYNRKKAENEDAAQRAYWAARKAGRKEFKAVLAKVTVKANFRKGIGK